MATKSQINRLLKRAKSRQEKNKSGDFMRRFLDAHKRGMVLCKDGKERTFQEWIDTKPPYLREILNNLAKEK